MFLLWNQYKLRMFVLQALASIQILKKMSALVTDVLMLISQLQQSPSSKYLKL